MSSKILIKRSSVQGKAPTTTNLSAGEMALNLRDAKMFAASASEVFEIGSNVSSSSIGTLTVGNSSPYTFPTTDGSADQVLTTDGSGTLRFADQASGGGGSSQNTFSSIAVSGQDNVSANNTTDTLTLAAGDGITLATNSTAQSVTISSSVVNQGLNFGTFTSPAAFTLDMGAF